MPELKRNFLKGKMNKDLDERLVPNGEYRDALNIEISTSEGSNQGSVQTINGNVELAPQDNTVRNIISSTATTVGSIVDETNNHIYNFVHKAANLGEDGTGIISDAIIQLKPKSSYSSSDSAKVDFTPIITDVYEARYIPDAFDGNIISGLPESYFFFSGGISYIVTEGVYPGMKVQAIDANGIDLWAGADIRVKYQESNGDVVLTSTAELSSVYTAQNITDGVYIKFSKPRFLNFSSGTSEIEINVGDGTSSSNTPNHTIITGINIVDNFLLFTDGRTEPKKINIDRFKYGTSSVRKNSELYIKVKDEYIKTRDLVDESHVSLIRKNPNAAPRVDVSNVDASQANEGPSTFTAQGSTSGAQGSYQPFKLAGLNNAVFQANDVFYIQTLTLANLQPGDIVRLIGATSSVVATAKITNAYSNNKYRLILRTIDPAYDPATASAEYWIVSKVKSTAFYNEKFVYFAYRYVYTDGERSCISPYSSSAFLPGTYSYAAEDGFNFGVENLADKFTITQFIPNGIPGDVIEIELIIRTSDSENAYIFKSIKKGDLLYAGNGFLEITTEQAGVTISSDQLLRPFDNVPTSAISQEFGGGRVIYGNYKQDFNLKDHSGQYISPKIRINSQSIPTSFDSVIDGAGNFAAYRSVESPTYISTIDNAFNVYENNILIEGWYGYVEATQNPWFQRFRKIASSVSSSYFPDDQNYIWATNRGLYVGSESLSDPFGNYTVSGSGDLEGSPYVYYYTAPSNGNYTFNFDIKATYTPPGTAYGGSANAFSYWRIAIYECDANGQIANLDGSYATTPDPIWVGNPTKGIEGILWNNSGDVNQGYLFQNNGQQLVPFVDSVEVYLEATKKYQVFILTNDEPLGIDSDGTVTDSIYIN